MRKPLVLFYFLVLYATAQLVWWGILLIRAEPELNLMIIGEGLFFFLIFIFGIVILRRALIREHKGQVQQRNFLLAVTHELKSPLASIKLYIQTILKRDLNKEQQQQFLSNSLKDIERLDYLVENVLIATKLENTRFSFPKEPVELSSLIQGIVDRLHTHSANRGIAIHTSVQADNITINGDRFALTNVFNNLIENAVKYSPEQGEVSLTLAEKDAQVIFTVADQGIGIPADEKKLIFNKFYRVGSEGTRKTKGTGLGLYIVKTVLEKHDAQIRVFDNKPTGSIFEITFDAHAS